MPACANEPEHSTVSVERTKVAGAVERHGLSARNGRLLRCLVHQQSSPHVYLNWLWAEAVGYV